MSGVWRLLIKRVARTTLRVHVRARGSVSARNWSRMVPSRRRMRFARVNDVSSIRFRNSSVSHAPGENPLGDNEYCYCYCQPIRFQISFTVLIRPLQDRTRRILYIIGTPNRENRAFSIILSIVRIHWQPEFFRTSVRTDDVNVSVIIYPRHDPSFDACSVSISWRRNFIKMSMYDNFILGSYPLWISWNLLILEALILEKVSRIYHELLDIRGVPQFRVCFRLLRLWILERARKTPWKNQCILEVLIQE